MEQKNSTFTLAEILIAIGIIGVVSALTIPNLLQYYNKYQTAQKVKQAYGIFQNALRLSVSENGDVNGWRYTNEVYKQDFDKYIIPYVKNNGKKVFYYYTATMATNGTGYLYWSYNNVYQLFNGMGVVFMLDHSKRPLISVDLNGNKGPNRLGIDIFVFYINKNTNSIKTYYDTPSGAYGCNRNYSGNNRVGISCAGLIEKKGWKIDKDYPWGNGK